MPRSRSEPEPLEPDPWVGSKLRELLNRTVVPYNGKICRNLVKFIDQKDITMLTPDGRLNGADYNVALWSHSDTTREFPEESCTEDLPMQRLPP